MLIKLRILKLSRPFSVGARALLYLLCVLAVAALAGKVALERYERQRGVTYGLPPAVPLAAVSPFGVNVSLEQYSEDELDSALRLLKGGGFQWVRQHFPWERIEPVRGGYRWEQWDRMVAACHDHGLPLIAVLDTSPVWARSERDQDNAFAPPVDLEWYGRFVKEFVARYRGEISYFELWDEPNIYPHWGEDFINPTSYTRLLKAGYLAAKAEDPGAVILAGGLAPNVEPGGVNMSDLLFLEGVYEAGGKDYFDVLAIKPYGLWTGPEDRRLGEEITNFSRATLLRQLMERHGDEEKAIWAVEFGWNALPEGWTGKPSIWGASSEEEQATYTVGAIERARNEWPWLGVMALEHLQPQAESDDPAWGFALLQENLSPRLVFQAVKRLATTPPALYIGYYGPRAWGVEYQGAWKASDGDSMSGSKGDNLSLRFKGTRLDLLTGEGFPSGSLEVSLDGKALPGPFDEEGESRVTLVRGIEDGEHLVGVTVGGEGDAHLALEGFVVSREASPYRYYAFLGLMAAGFSFSLWRAIGLLKALPLREWWDRLERGYLEWSEGKQIAAMVLVTALFYFPSGLALTALGALILVPLVSWRMDLALALAVFSIPFFLCSKALGPKAFSPIELWTLLLLALLLWQKVRSKEVRLGLWQGLRGVLRRLSALDASLLFFITLAFLSLAVSEHLAVSLRELRTVVLEPAIFYLLLQSLTLRRKELLRLIDGLVLAGLALSLFGLYQYIWSGDVIVAEGVRRIRGVYGSPNNLGLFLGRVWPVLLAMALFAKGSSRRLSYGLVGVPLTLCLYLTYSRGAWLLGIPFALLFSGLMRGRRGLLFALGVILLILLSLLPSVGRERITSLFYFSEGTTFLRLKLWQASIHMVRDHPLFGVGLDNFLYQYPRYRLPEAWPEPYLSHPHNIILDFWTRLGIGGLVALVLLEVFFFRTGISLYRRLGEGEMRALVLGLMASMADFLGHGLIDNSYFLVDLAFVFSFSLGVIRLADKLHPRQRIEHTLQ